MKASPEQIPQMVIVLPHRPRVGIPIGLKCKQNFNNSFDLISFQLPLVLTLVFQLFSIG